MNRKTKSEDLQANAPGWLSKLEPIAKNDFEDAMQLYADQEMALFYAYVEENYHSWKEGELYLHTSLFHGDNTHYTTQQLITKYKEENP